MKALCSDSALLNSSEGVLSICAGGYTIVKTLAIPKLLQSLSLTGQVCDIGDAVGANLQLHFADGSQRRVTLNHNLNDFTVRSILKVLKRVLPADLY